MSRRGMSRIIANNIRHKLDDMGITVHELSVRSGVSSTMLYHILNYRTIPTLYTARLIADELYCSVEDLLEGYEG